MRNADDRAIIEQLRGMLRAQQLPAADVIDAAHAAFDARSLDDEIGELVADTFEQLPAGVRRRASLERDLTFGFDGCDLTVRLDGPDLLGQVIGADIVSASLMTPLESLDLVVEGSGFVTDRPAESLVRFVLETEGGRRLSTEWIRL